MVCDGWSQANREHNEVLRLATDLATESRLHAMTAAHRAELEAAIGRALELTHAAIFNLTMGNPRINDENDADVVALLRDVVSELSS